MDPIERQAFDISWQIQDACNPVAVVGEFHRQLLALSHLGMDHPTLEHHPALLIMLDKIGTLFDRDAIDAAYGQVLDVVKA